MTECLTATLPLTCWRGERGTYHLVTFSGDEADQIALHERMHRLEFGSRRGFGSVKVMARIGETEWKTSLFPQRERRGWVLLVSKGVMRAERLTKGDEVGLEVQLL